MSANRYVIASDRVALRQEIRPAAILIESGRIAAVGERGDFQGLPREDLGPLMLMPGLIDCHVHINEPGRTEWEGFETATRAAAAGGVTTVADMPLNSSPVTTTLEALAAKEEAARGRLFVDCGFHCGLVHGNARAIPELLKAGVLGVKAFMVHSGIDEFPSADRGDLAAALESIAGQGVPLLVHAELDRIPARAVTPPNSYAAYLASRPDGWEVEAIELLIDLCRRYRSPVHIVHLSSSHALPSVARAKTSGLPLTVETAPHYLTFASEEISDGATHFKCAPPIRGSANRERLWIALQDGLIDMIATDHSPCPPSMKLMEQGDFAEAWGGVSSLQLLLPAVWSGLRSRQIPIERLCAWLCEAPARLLGLAEERGRIAPGFRADLVAWDPDASFTVDAEKLQHRHKITPYHGRSLWGKVHATYLKGARIFSDGEVVSTPRGEIVRRSMNRS